MTAPVGAAGAPPRQHGGAAGIARAATGVALVTALARLLGFARVVVFARTVGTATCLGSTYYTANTVPNILFEVVAGGALASLVVPALAGPVERGDAAAARRTTAALLGWSLLLLTPLAVAVAVLARPVMALLYAPVTAACPTETVLATGARMLVVFAPQVVLYGVAVVLTGVLQAHRRFLGPALAPLLSSVVVLTAYLLYGALSAGRSPDLTALSRVRELTLSVGTTLGVAALALPLLVPLRRAGAPVGLGLRFPAGVAARVRRLALAGAAALAAQQLSVAVVLRLADRYDPRGGIVLYTLAWTLFLVPWAVLAVPIATSAFPALAAAADAGDERGYTRTVAGTSRGLVLVALGAAAALAAVALPAARVLVLGTRGQPDPAVLARAVVAFAPGLVGYALVAHLGRALYARGAGRVAAAGTVAGWLAVVVADLLLVPAAPAGWVVAALAAGNTVGMTLAGAALAGGLVRAAGPAALAGLPRAATAGLAGAAVAGGLGALVAGRLTGGIAASLAGCAVAGGCVLAVYAGLVLLLDGADLRALLRRRLAGA